MRLKWVSWEQCLQLRNRQFSVDRVLELDTIISVVIQR